MPIQQRSQLKGFGQSTNEKYIVEDIHDLVTEANTKPYKVFTALLAQSGGNDPRYMQGDGGGDISSATKGTTVLIYSNLNNIDYSSIGAPNSNVGTYFILTQDITLSNLDNETTFIINTGAPVATVLENTLGNIFFTYRGLGNYNCLNSDGLFINNKTFILNGTMLGSVIFNRLIQSDGSGFGAQVGYFFEFSDNSTIRIKSLGDADVFQDSILNGFIPIEIRVYN